MRSSYYVDKFDVRERRKYPRFYVSFPIEYKTLSPRKYFYSVSKDLSLGGVRIMSNKFQAKDSFVKVDVNLINRILSFNAKVAWCNKERMSDRYSIGLEFVDIPFQSKNALSELFDSVGGS